MTINQKLNVLENAKQEGASPEELERLSAVLFPGKGGTPSISKAVRRVMEDYMTDSKDEKPQTNMEKVVTDILHEMGVPSSIKGHRYLRTAIILCIEDDKKVDAVTKKLYPAIAKMYDTTWQRVERAIRHAIEVAWDRGNVKVFNEYFGYTIQASRGKPTSSEFIATIVDHLKLQYKL